MDIKIKKSYFDNIETAINSLNSFFSSNFKNKDFPVLDGDYKLDSSIMHIISLMNGIDPEWIDNIDYIESVIEKINEVASQYEENAYGQICDNNDSQTIDAIDSFVSYKALQFISEHFDEFSKLLNGIYSFELFTKPAEYKNEIDLFSQDINISELDVAEDIHTPIFDGADYIKGLFESEQVTFPKEMNEQDELKRFYNYQPSDANIIIEDDTNIEPVQEAAEVNYFTKRKPVHIKYDDKKDMFHISAQFRKSIDNLVKGLEKCKTTEDLLEFFDDPKGRYPEADDFSENVIPFILAKVFNNTKKYPNQDFNMSAFRPYINSYKSIADNNPGAKRFVNYDLFSTFKSDKRGTIQFIIDFCEINLYNDASAAITNNNLLTIFNIFDSRIYFDILYNLIPDKVKRNKYPSEDDFVKSVRARINRNSRNTNVYKPEVKAAPENEVPTESEVTEYTKLSFDEFGDMSIADMMYCEQYTQILRDEINTLDSRLFAEGLSPAVINSKLSEYEVLSVCEAVESGKLPGYINDRFDLAEKNGTKPQVTETDVQVPPDVPTNSISDLADSIDAKMNVNSDDIGDMLGEGSKARGGNITYNITYNNSFNRDDHSDRSTHMDSSHGKTTTKSTTTNVTHSHTNSHNTNGASNNNNNSSNSNADTKDSKNVQEFSTGYSVEDVFAFLESEEPLSSSAKATTKKPTSDLLTAAMDMDRKTLSMQQKVKKGVQKGMNTTKALLKPAARTKAWLSDIVNSLIKRDNDAVKAEILNDQGYRKALFKASRLALKLGMATVAFTINGYLGAAYLAIEGAKAVDKQRLKREVAEEMATEIAIVNDKIAQADAAGNYDEKYRLMRLKTKMEDTIARTPSSVFKHPSTVA